MHLDQPLYKDEKVKSSHEEDIFIKNLSSVVSIKVRRKRAAEATSGGSFVYNGRID